MLSRIHRRSAALLVLLAVFLTACGGGAAGGGSNKPPQAALSLSTSQVSASLEYRVGGSLRVGAHVNDPSAFGSGPLFVLVVDPQGILEGVDGPRPVDASNYEAALRIKRDLAPGQYQGQWQVRLCKDAACAAEYPGSPLQLGFDIKVAQGRLHSGSPMPERQQFYSGELSTPSYDLWVDATTSWTVSSDAPWLKLEGATGTGNGKARVTLDARSLPAGTHSARITVKGSDGQLSTHLYAVEVVSNRLFSSSPQVEWSGVNGSSLASTTLSLTALGSSQIAWMASASAGWIKLLSSTGQTPGPLTLVADLSNVIAGVYTGSISITAQGLLQPLTVPVKLNVAAATLKPSSTNIVLGGVDGRKLQDSQTLSLSLNTGSKAWPWQVKEAPGWLQVSSLGGLISAESTAITLSLKRDLLQAGSTKGVLKLEARVAGDLISTSVDLTAQVDRRRLLPSAWGIGFSSTPNGQVLTRTLTVRDSQGGDLSWKASSSAPWLQASGSGSTGSNSVLTLRAIPDSLPQSSLSYATVTLTTTVPGVEPVRLRVGLWKDAVGLSEPRRLPDRYTHVQSDPIRPHVYLHSGGSTVDVFHAFTGLKLRSFTNLGSSLAGMTVEPDGGRLFVLDTGSRRVAVVDLEANAALTPWNLGAAVHGGTVPLAVKVDGVSLLLLADGQALREGQLLPALALDSYSGSLASSGDGRILVKHVQGISPSSTYRFKLDYSVVNGGVLAAKKLAENWSLGGAGNGKDVAVSLDGETTVTASGAPYACPRGDAKLDLLGMLPGGSHYPNNAELLSDGRWVCGASSTYESTDVWVHSADGVLEESFRIGSYGRSMLDRQLVATPDGRILIGLSEEPKLVFQPLRPR
ncbi:BACON domain-containing protein [Inhella proteolytica]|uniref:BACON domain-containing protein n=1 Tax=Inhella proteolytica TaxID=2795029 RepID=UPI0018DD8DA8|nr:hypothetical protein [Inhella proteolytica]